MAKGQLTYLQRVNRVLLRLGKAQTTDTLSGVAADTWPGIVRDLIKESEGEIVKEHDWSTLMTSGTFSTSSRTYDLSSSFSNFLREIDLVSTTNQHTLVPVDLKDLDQYEPLGTVGGAPTAYHIGYPNLLFSLTPSSESFRLRYIKRPTAPSANGDTSDLPEECDMAQVWWVIWQLNATREDATDGGAAAQDVYKITLARAIGQDRRRMDRVYVMQPFAPRRQPVVPFPRTYGQNNY